MSTNLRNTKPCLHIDLRKHDVLPAAIEMLTWIDGRNIKVLNVAGPRASKDPKIYKMVKEVLTGLWLLSSSRDQYLHSIKLSKPSSPAEIKRPETVNKAVDRLMSEMNLKDLNKVANMRLPTSP